MSERLTTRARHTVACPACDSPSVWTRPTVPDTAYRCGECKATFDEAVVRPYEPDAGGAEKYGDLSPEDVGL
jgi:transposase-like protein